jgi:hypothetical protein
VRDPAPDPHRRGLPRLHAGPRFGNDFDIIANARAAGALPPHDLRMPDGYLDRCPRGEVGRALDARDLPACRATTTCCRRTSSTPAVSSASSTTSSPATTIPTFELGDIAAEADFDPDRTEALAAAYFGDELTPALAARVRLNLTAVQCGLDAVVLGPPRAAPPPHRHVRLLERGGRQMGPGDRDLDAPDFGRLLDAVAGRSHQT